MPSIHTPERLQGESQQDYRKRRKQSKAHNDLITAKGVDSGVNSRKQFRDHMRSSGTMGKRTRAYKALMASWAAKRVTKTSLHDEHGAITLIGSPVELVGVKPSSREFEIEGGVDHGERFHTVRRIWLAGISAQRGY